MLELTFKLSYIPTINTVPHDRQIECLWEKRRGLELRGEPSIYTAFSSIVMVPLVDLSVDELNGWLTGCLLTVYITCMPCDGYRGRFESLLLCPLFVMRVSSIQHR